MHRMVVNPGTPQVWEIQLREGTNRLGRTEANDFQINDPSISGSHCQILVNGDSAVITDLGSTNGTFVNRAQVAQEAKLENGHAVRLGGVETVFYSDAPVSVTAVKAPPLRASLRISGAAAAPPAAVAPPVLEEPPAIPASPPLAPALPGGRRFCKFHPKSPARYLCHKCNRTFCEFCVTSRTAAGAAKKMCRSCGVELQPLEVRIGREKKRGFFASLPGAFIFPFRGTGALILICATIAIAALGFISAGILSIFAKIVFYGFLFLFMQNIIFTTTSDENESLSLPDMDGIFGAALTLAGTILVSFGLAIGLEIALLCGVGIPVEAIIGAVILGCLYFPMAFLAAAMKDTALAANPLVVIPAILKIPFQYLVASMVLMSVFGVRQLGSLLSGVAGSLTFSTRETSVFFISLGLQAVWAFLSVYLLTVSVRILGLLYNANKEKLGWF